jgi:hypothetical protein
LKERLERFEEQASEKVMMEVEEKMLIMKRDILEDLIPDIINELEKTRIENSGLRIELEQKEKERERLLSNLQWESLSNIQQK